MEEAHRPSHLAARISPEGIAVVRQQKTTEDAHIIRLSVADQQRFAELLLKPPPLSPAMERARAAHHRLIRQP